MSLADKVEQLTDIRDNIREKLIAKGVDASAHNFANFPNDVENIPSGGGTDGQFFPMNMTEFMLPKMTLTYNGEEI